MKSQPIPPLLHPPRRRWTPVVFWTILAVVVIARLLVPFERFSEPRGRFGDNPGRFRRPPTRVHPPVYQVPADLWRVQIEIAPKDVQQLRGHFWGGRGSHRQPRPEVLATVREGTNVYRNVSLHLKGAAGSFRPFDDKPAFTLNFSRQAPGQRFHGFDKISLNNSVQDPSYLCEAISREMFDAAGVPVPRAGHVTVIVNGRDLGLYVMTEGYGKSFLRRYFSNVSGNLYDGGFVQDITSDLDTNSGDRRDDRSQLDQLIEAAMEPDSTNRWMRLTPVLDIDRFLSFLAMEVITCHWDGYALNKNNYRVFHDASTGRMVFMPHGLDQMFGVFRSTPRSSIKPPMEGLVARAVTGTPQGRALFRERIATLRTNVFQEARWINRVRELARRIRPTLAAYAPDLAQEHDAQVDYLCQRITERAQSISEQLAAPQKAIAFNKAGAAVLSGWAPRITATQPGNIQFHKVEQDGIAQLRITAAREGGAGSWRTRIALPEGQYRFEGRARTQGVGGGGVCLRISGSRDLRLQAAEGEWTPVRFAFNVEEPEAEVELICELRAARGEASFDTGSLRVVRE